MNWVSALREDAATQIEMAINTFLKQKLSDKELKYYTEITVSPDSILFNELKIPDDASQTTRNLLLGPYVKNPFASFSIRIGIYFCVAYIAGDEVRKIITSSFEMYQGSRPHANPCVCIYTFDPYTCRVSCVFSTSEKQSINAEKSTSTKIKPVEEVVAAVMQKNFCEYLGHLQEFESKQEDGNGYIAKNYNFEPISTIDDLINISRKDSKPVGVALEHFDNLYNTAAAFTAIRGRFLILATVSQAYFDGMIQDNDSGITVKIYDLGEACYPKEVTSALPYGRSPMPK